ncbi:hypothetical protein NE237_009552 [Protea cynaroides]|uniref:Reverse transcriptase zinc-binding domain-containing protein n=1 Tax=Protea cynaroides TaxID=273540 RepID=A0A9Q0KXN4_9MAGN|nr:hypothetical protein NE237_009552 [Protea cynaroides]
MPENSPAIQNFWNQLAQVKRKSIDSRDLVHWNQMKSSSFSSKSAWNACRVHYPKVPWLKAIWLTGNIPRQAFVTWSSVLDCLPISDQIRKRNVLVSAGCCLCDSSMESVNHLFFNCLFSSSIRESSMKMMNLSSRPPSSMGVTTLASWVANNLNYMGLLLFCSSIYNIWRERNRRKFASKARSVNEVTHVVLKDATELLMLNQHSRREADFLVMDRANTVFDVH